MRILILFSLFIMILSVCYSQKLELSNIPFQVGERNLSLPFVGGMRATHLSNLDINLDGRQDVFIYDKEGGVTSILVATDDGFELDHSYRRSFPPARSWMLLRDYNGDGIADIFCSPTQSSVPGIEVWKGHIVNGKLGWELVTFPGRDFNILYIPLGSSFTQIYVSTVDLPEISDIDGDGDLDILSFEPAGLTVYFYKNMAVERGLGKDGLDYILGDACFGKFVESGFSQAIDLSSSDRECANQNSPNDNPIVTIRHSGSTVTAIDPNNDGLKDLLIGDISYDGIVYLENNGTQSAAWMTYEEVRWPEDNENPLNIELFNAAHEIEILGTKKLLITPNDKVSSQTDQHLWLYNQNESSGSFELESKSFLIEDMIMLGKNSYPTYVDYNFDGLLDIVVGSNGLNTDGITQNPRLFLFLNTGTLEAPAFTLNNDDLLSFSEFSGTSRCFAPSFGDLDGDKDIDLIVGDNNGYLYYIENQSGLPNLFQWKKPVYKAFDVKVSAWATPVIFDWNQDGLGDLIIGEQNFNSFEGRLGSFNYFENVGSANQPQFIQDVNQLPNDPALGNIFLKTDGFINNYSALGILDNGEAVTIVASNEAGKIYLYEDVLSYSKEDTFQLTSQWGLSIFEGSRATPVLGDIDKDGFIDLLIGNARGGLAIYHTDLVAKDVNSNTDLQQIDLDLKVFPNPTNHMINYEFDIEFCQDCRVEIISMDGVELVKEGVTVGKGQILINKFPAGAYVFNLIGTGVKYQKLITILGQ